MRSLLISLCLILICSGMVYATAWESALIGERSAAMGNAYAAISDTPEAFHFNPAGLAQMDNLLSVSVGANFPFTLEYEYVDPEGGSNTSGGVPIPPHIYACSKIWKIAFGVGYWIPIGGGEVSFDGIETVNFSNETDEGSFTNTYTKLYVHDIAPTLSVELNEWVYLGASFVIHVGQLGIGLENFPKDSNLGVSYVDMDYEGIATSYGGSFGILLKDPFLEMISLGVSYRMQYTMKTEGETTFDLKDEFSRNFAISNGLDLPGTFDTNSEIIIPHMISVGVALDLFDFIIIAVDFQYSMWSDCKEINLYWDVEIPEAITSLGGLTNHQVIKTGYEDAYYAKLGLEIHAMPSLDVRAGFIYAQEAKTEYANSLLSIDTKSYIITYGAGYKLGFADLFDLSFDLTLYNVIGKETEVTEAALAETEDFSGPVGTYNRNILFGMMFGVSLYLF